MNKTVILLFISILIVPPHSKAMEIQSVSLEQKIKQLNRKATFLYEQLFFFELLSAIILTRRTDNFHADVLFARDQIRASTEPALTNNPLPFDPEAPPHEKYKYTHFYYALKYLIEQNHFRQFTIDYETSKHKNPLDFMDSILPLLNKFASFTIRDRLLLLYQWTESLPKLLYSYKSKANSLNFEYWAAVDSLRVYAKTANQIHYLFHAYLEQPRKILLLTFNWTEEDVPDCSEIHYRPLDTYPYPIIQDPLLHQNKGCFCCLSKNLKQLISSFFHKRTTAPSSYIPIASPTIDTGRLIFLYDFLEYWTARISPMLQQPEELHRLAPKFLQSFRDNHLDLQDDALPISLDKDPHQGIKITADLCQLIYDSLDNFEKQPPQIAATYVTFIKEAVKEYEANRHR
jgi:hypothetical protein